ncbi:hypothetical protein DFH29DRAFT_429385 [Suillus ampliporus]|nr:hypothetical protein DFH29DRAFT_429385 [Suillus ampliporus]
MVLLLKQADISIGTTLQHANYAFFAIVGLWVYDFALTFDEEVEFMLNARWKIATLLYVICRYLPFAMVIIDVFRIVQPGLSVKTCMTCFALNGYVGVIVLCCAEPLFILRLCAFLGGRRRTLIIALCNYALFLIPMLVTVTLYNSSSIVLQSPIPQVASCYSNRDGRILIIAYMLLIIGELEILSFTLYRSWRLYREIGNELPLVRILIRHNVSYFACGLFFSVMAPAAIYTLPGSYGDVASDLQVVMHAILVTRIHRELCATARRPEASSTRNVSLPLTFLAGPSSGCP